MADFNVIEAGYVVVGLFIVVWLAAIAYWKTAHIEDRWTVNTQPED